MGGRGASSASGRYKLDKIEYEYGDEYTSFLQHGDVKFVERFDDRATKAPTESRTPGRKYVTVNKKTGQLHSIAYIGDDGKSYKRIDFQNHGKLKEHAHDIKDGEPGDPRPLSKAERRMLAQVRTWYDEYRNSKQ